MQDIIGVLLIDRDGNILRNTMPEVSHPTEIDYCQEWCNCCANGCNWQEHAKKYIQEIPALAIMTRSAVREIDAKDDLTMMRIKSRKHEMMIIVEEKFTLMALQEYPGFWVEPPPPPPTPPGDSDDDYDE